MATPMRLIAVSAFGIETVVKHELRALGYNPAITEPGKIEFDGDASAIVTANFWLRAASRVLVQLARFPAADFDQLYEGVRSIGWADVIPSGAAVGVRAKTTRSTINSPRSTQSIVKRAIVDALTGRGGTLDESGPGVSVDVAIVSDSVTVALDTSGAGLHRRGYRPRSGPGQLKETLAAGIVQLTRWHPDRPLVDPFCGQGTIVIEAAMLAAGIAPGANRTFAGEHLPWIDPDRWRHAREEARAVEPAGTMAQILGRDINDAAVGEARRAAERAGVRGLVGFRTGDFHEVTRAADRGWIVTNPPYGLRVLDHEEARRIHADLPTVLAQLPGWSHAILTAFPGFEKLIRQEATRRRKLYNGSIECGLYIFRPTFESPQPTAEQQAVSQRSAPKPAFGDTSGRDEIAASFAAALNKRIRHLRRWPEKLGVEAYRVYDGQTPGAGVFIDRIGDWLRVTDRGREGDRPLAESAAWMDRLASIASQAAGVPADRVVLVNKRSRSSNTAQLVSVREGELRYVLDPADPEYGPPIDGRSVRELVRRWSGGRRVLHIGAGDAGSWLATIVGGASWVQLIESDPIGATSAERVLRDAGVVSVERCVREDPATWLSRQTSLPGSVDLIVVQPLRSESKSWGQEAEAESDSIRAILHAARSVLTPSGRLLLVRRGGRGDPTGWRDGWAEVREMTSRTVPEDYSHSKPHRSWLFHAGR